MSWLLVCSSRFQGDKRSEASESVRLVWVNHAIVLRVSSHMAFVDWLKSIILIFLMICHPPFNQYSELTIHCHGVIKFHATASNWFDVANQFLTYTRSIRVNLSCHFLILTPPCLKIWLVWDRSAISTKLLFT